ncbi:hypothetical protein HMPREF0326_02460 [Desulfovibrio sp. 3_1_syn3]|uniref:carboxymuconolactone decarboxylase family protein n=1 Tax=Desulfovibrio sp. 3_1_syn3 TaxID=457398 RepID=UPI0001E12DB0|nr:carboxymuconolactone decarboxylase family protein [Desulfovibrio sp. 3_1_syn3]EFL85131.1 hypothetical protein HMPREF0326_02460 [Desulfovibrio sp. 3_1_syn3]
MKKLFVFRAVCCALALTITLTEARSMDETQTLNARQRGIVTIAAFTANGDLEKLKPALHDGLEAGLTVNEIKEVLVQLYAYTGFPRSLNGIGVFMAVMDERKARGIRDEEGREPSPLPANLDRDAHGARVRAELAGWKSIPAPSGYQLFTPAIDAFLKQHLFADIFARDNLDHQSRELATIAALAAMPGLGAQLRFHLGAAMNTGLSPAQLRDFIAVLDAGVGKKEAVEAGKVLDAVLTARSGQAR